MRLHHNRFACTLMCLLAVLLLASASLAAEAENVLYIEGSASHGDVFHVFFGLSGENAPDLQTLGITVNGEELPVQSIVTYDYADAGTTYLILIDSSTSVIERALRDIRYIAAGIANGMSMNDNICIAQLGESFDDADLLTDSAEISARIDALSMSMPGDDLYQSLADALTFLERSGRVLPRQCIVVIADGMDQNAGGISQLELLERIQASHASVSTIALTYNTANPDRVSAAKELSSLARQSRGGVNLLLGTNGVTTADAISAVLELRAHSYAAVLNVSDIRAVTNNMEALFRLTWTDEAQNACYDEYTIDLSALPLTGSDSPVESAAPSSDLQADQDAPAQQVTAAPVESETDTAASGAPSKLPAWVLWDGIGTVVLIVAAILLAVLLKKRSHRNSLQPAVSYDEKQSDSVDGPELVLVRTGEQEGIRCSLKMTKPLVIGRDPARAHLVLDEDPALCGAQCRLEWKNGALLAIELAPEGSTLLNGAPVGTGKAVQSGDLLRIGSYVYRVFWERD